MNILKRFLSVCLVTIMITLFSKAFGMSIPQVHPMGATRSINIKENLFRFSMPENFSDDFPASPLVETVATNIPGNGALLLQRWWDIRSTGFFKKNLGVVMMRINIKPVPQNKTQYLSSKPYDTRRRLDFMLSINERISQHSSLNNENGISPPQFASLVGDTLSSNYRDSVFNDQKWISYSSSGANNLLIETHAIPVDSQLSLEVAFEYAPNNNVLPQNFVEQAHQQLVSRIENSMEIQYHANSDYTKVVAEQWKAVTADDALLAAENEIIMALFGAHLKTLPPERLPPKLQRLLALPGK